MSKLNIDKTCRFLILTPMVTFLLLSCNITRKYAPESIRQWEKDIVQFEQLDKREKDPDNGILFVGSSSIRLWSTLKEDVAPYPVIQRGFGGSKFSDLSVYAKRIIYPHQFRALVIFEANDITGGMADKSPKEVISLFRNIIRTVRRKYPYRPVFVVEITPTQSRWPWWPKIKKVNQLLKASCSALHNTWFIETAAAYLDKEGKPRNELFIKDMLHQNREGYQIWGDLIRKKLDMVLSQSPGL